MTHLCLRPGRWLVRLSSWGGLRLLGCRRAGVGLELLHSERQGLEGGLLALGSVCESEYMQ